MTWTTWHWPVRCAIATSPITFWVLIIKDQMTANYSIREQIDWKKILSSTLKQLVGLIASTGLRVSEAIRLTVRGIHLDADPSHLEITAGASTLHNHRPAEAPSLRRPVGCVFRF